MRIVKEMRGRHGWRSVVGLQVLALALALPLAASPPSSAPSDEQVRRVSEVLYIHGMTREIAEEEIGPAGNPALIRLLWNPEFERRDNVVAFLAYLGDAETVTELLRFLDRRPFSTDVPEEDRALLLIPEALGRIAGRTGDETALAALLAWTGGAAATDRDLAGTAMRGLMFTGREEARERLAELATGRVVPVAGLDLTGTAVALLDWFDRRGSDSATSDTANVPERASVPSAWSSSPELAPESRAPGIQTDFDVSDVVHELPIDYANHVDLVPSEQMNDAWLDQLLVEASDRIGMQDFAGDVDCCATLVRSAPGRWFGTSGDGLDIIDIPAELIAVLTDPVARAKVVRQIAWCAGGTTTNTIGCAFTPGTGFAVVRLSGLGREAVLWAHEFGHNMGMEHTSDARYIMNGSIDDVGGLYDHECRNLHLPPEASVITPVVVGTCSDADGDGRHEGIDNCPHVANPDQSDRDQDGVGDACDSCPGRYNPGQQDGDQDSIGDACDNCPSTPNSDQSDRDKDEVGDACDNCPLRSNPGQEDGDQDSVGDACDNCPATSNPGQDNADADAPGDACDNCPYRFNPAQMDFDGDAIGDACEQGALLADANGSGRVDGFDLVRLALAFGSQSAEANYEPTVDLDRNGRVDGEDLAILAEYFGEYVN